MQTIHIEFHVDAPLERVFDDMSDHQRFLTDGRGTVAKILRPGTHERDGLGCLREIRKGLPIRFVEEITAFQRPAAFEYLITETSLPLKHFGGRMSFRAGASGTEVEWSSSFEITIPLARRLIEPITKRLLLKAFDDFLRASKKRLEHQAEHARA